VGNSGGDDDRGRTSEAGQPRIANGILRLLLELFALLSLAFWGYLAWPFPWPALLFALGAPLFAALIWWLFRSPKAPLPLDPVGKTVVEFLLLGSVVAAWFMLDYPIVGAVFGAIAAISGIMYGRAEIVKDHP
jgi:hypothetical protein